MDMFDLVRKFGGPGSGRHKIDDTVRAKKSFRFIPKTGMFKSNGKYVYIKKGTHGNIFGKARGQTSIKWKSVGIVNHPEEHMKDIEIVRHNTPGMTLYK